MSSKLTAKTCQPCTGATPALSPQQIGELAGQLNGWEVTEKELRKSFKFKNYHETMAFVNATAYISHHEDHHPDMEVGYNKVTMRYSTHSAGGITENDFICASKIDALLSI